MATVTVKRAVLWRTETSNAPGTLARTLYPLARARQNLEIVMGYAYPDRRSAAIEVYPISSKSAVRAARSAGLTRCNFPCLVVSGANRPGLGHDIANSLAEAGINLSFFVAQVVGNRYTGMFGFEADSEADLAARLIRKATNGARRPARSRRKSAPGRTRSVRTARRGQRQN